MSQDLGHTIDIAVDASAIDPFIAKMERLIESARAVFGEDASLEFACDMDITLGAAGEHVLHPYCKSLEVRR